MSTMKDLVKMLIFHGFEPAGCRKSDSLIKNDSFWWARLRTSKMRPIGVYLSIACHYRRLFVHCLSLLAYICSLPVTIGVYLSNACHYRRIFVHRLSLSAYICPLPVTIGVYLSIARTKIVLAGPPWRAPTLVYIYWGMGSWGMRILRPIDGGT